MLKRTADWLEKMSVAAMAVGIFQGNNNYGVVPGGACFPGTRACGFPEAHHA